MKRRSFGVGARIGAGGIASLVALTLVGVTPTSAQAEEPTILARIGVLSDVHVTDAAGSLADGKLAAALQSLSDVEGGLDVMAFAGDLTDNGTQSEMLRFRGIVDSEIDRNRTQVTAAMGNHEFYAYGWGVDVDRNPGMREQMHGWFTDIVGSAIEEEVVSGGIHILTVSPDDEMDSYQGREAFLTQRITAAAAENPQAPIIINAHKPVPYTTMTSGEAPDGSYASLAADWSPTFKSFLAEHPQVIYISGHSHDDIRNPRTMYQQDFTSVQAGAGINDAGILVTIDSEYNVTIDRKNFATGTDFNPSWRFNSADAVADPSTFPYRANADVKNVSLTVGADTSTLNVNWVGRASTKGQVQLALASDVVNGRADEVRTFTAHRTGASIDPTWSFHQVELTGLTADTEYAYRVGNASGWTPFETFHTAADTGDFSFLVFGDPQVGAGEGIPDDATAWQNTLTTATSRVPDAAFALSMGDQVNVAGNADEYDDYLTPSALRTMPWGTIVGNHDFASTAYSQYFSYPQSSAYGQSAASGMYSGDYATLIGGVLVMSLNSNVLDIQQHRNFLQETLLEYGDRAKWTVVTFHHAIFSAANHAEDAEVKTLRAGLAPLLSDLQINLVLTGHDHMYTRSKPMLGTAPSAVTQEADGVVTPLPGEVVYLTLSSSTGSKYYEAFDRDFDYTQVAVQNHTPHYSVADVTNDSLTLTTRNATDDSVVDRVAVARGAAPTGDAVKPYLFLPSTNQVLVGGTFDPLAGVSAADDDGTALTAQIQISGAVDTATRGVYPLRYSVADAAGNTTVIERIVAVVSEMTDERGLYFGLDVTSDETVSPESGTKPVVWFDVPASFTTVDDADLGRPVLRLSAHDYLEVHGMNAEDLGDDYTIEAYLKLTPEAYAAENGYELFQFGDQNLNLVGFGGDAMFFGFGRALAGDADVDTSKMLPVDQWTHVVMSGRDGEQAVYVDGELFAKGTYTGLDADSRNDSILRLGGSSYGRVGSMDLALFRIYNGSSTAAQAQRLADGVRPADYTAVDAALATIPEDLAPYTATSAEAVRIAAAAVERGLMLTAQDRVDAMASAISTAVGALELLPPAFSPLEWLDLTKDNDGKVTVRGAVRAGQDATIAAGKGTTGTVSVWLYSDAGSAPVALGDALLSNKSVLTATIPSDAPAGKGRIALYAADGALVGWDAVHVK